MGLVEALLQRNADDVPAWPPLETWEPPKAQQAQERMGAIEL
jgi:hypothetical protein